MQRTAIAAIDLNSLRHNLAISRLYAGDSKIMCVVKANAYGHGMLRIADALRDTDGFAVACVDEALELRRHGIQQPITVFQGFHNKCELETCVTHLLWPVLHHSFQLALLEDAAPALPAGVWLKFATGMNRLGFDSSEAKTIWQRLKSLNGIGDIRLMTHMARADEGADVDVKNDFTVEQINRFEIATEGLVADRSLANSAALIAWPASRAHWVRPGIMLYGASPFIEGRGPNLDLKPVMTLGSRIIAINHRKKGEPVGYGGDWTCPRDMRIAVVAIGYGDGYPRSAPSGTPVLINGRRAALAGRVSMDLLTVALEDDLPVAIGDEAILWGQGLPVDEIARHVCTISYELLCNVSNRVHFLYHGTNPA